MLSGCWIIQDLEIPDGFLCPVIFKNFLLFFFSFPLSVEELKELFLPHQFPSQLPCPEMGAAQPLTSQLLPLPVALTGALAAEDGRRFLTSMTLIDYHKLGP